MDPRKRRALALQETSDNVSSVATPRTRVPGKTSKVPPNLAPLDAVLPEDMRLAHTSTTLELMQAHASTNETKKGDTRRQRDVQRWRDEAGEVRDALLLRDEAERSAKMRLVNEMGAVAVGGTDDDGTCDGTSATSTDKPPSRAFGDERAPSRSHSVEWVQAYRPEQGAASATAKAARGAQGDGVGARGGARGRQEEGGGEGGEAAADPRSSFWKALDRDKTRAGAGERVRRDARGRGGEAGGRGGGGGDRAKRRAQGRRARRQRPAARRTARERFPEREDALRAGGASGGAEAGEVLAEDSRDDSRDDSRRAPSPFLCVIERGCAEIRVALNRDDFDDESDVGGDDGRTDSDIDRDADTRRPRRDGTRGASGSGPRASWRRSRGGTRLPSTAPRWRRCSAARRARRSRSSCATPKTPRRPPTARASCGNCATAGRSRRWRLRSRCSPRGVRDALGQRPRAGRLLGPRARVLHGRGAARDPAPGRATSASSRAPCAARRRRNRARHRAPRGVGGRNGGGRGALEASRRRGARCGERHASGGYRRDA